MSLYLGGSLKNLVVKSLHGDLKKKQQQKNTRDAKIRFCLCIPSEDTLLLSTQLIYVFFLHLSQDEIHPY